MTFKELIELIPMPTDMQLWIYESYEDRTQIAIVDIHETWGNHDRRVYLAQELLDFTVGAIRLGYREDDSAFLSINIYRYAKKES